MLRARPPSVSYGPVSAFCRDRPAPFPLSLLIRGVLSLGYCGSCLILRVQPHVEKDALFRVRSLLTLTHPAHPAHGHDMHVYSPMSWVVIRDKINLPW